MSAQHMTSQQELEELRNKIQEFEKEKERVRSIVGQIGGMPSFTKKIHNIVFIVLILACLVISVVTGGIVQLISIEFAVALLSLKIIYLVHSQGKVNHFQLWILTSMEWRLNEMMDHLNRVLPEDQQNA